MESERWTAFRNAAPTSCLRRCPIRGEIRTAEACLQGRCAVGHCRASWCRGASAACCPRTDVRLHAGGAAPCLSPHAAVRLRRSRPPAPTVYRTSGNLQAPVRRRRNARNRLATTRFASDDSVECRDGRRLRPLRFRGRRHCGAGNRCRNQECALVRRVRRVLFKTPAQALQ